MSSDTGIYIARFPDGYRVTNVVGCIENIFYYKEGSKRRKKELGKYFSKGEIFISKEEAYARAFKIYEEFEKDEEDFGMGCPIEYGIQYLGDLEDF